MDATLPPPDDFGLVDYESPKDLNSDDYALETVQPTLSTDYSESTNTTTYPAAEPLQHFEAETALTTNHLEPAINAEHTEPLQPFEAESTPLTDHSGPQYMETAHAHATEPEESMEACIDGELEMAEPENAKLATDEPEIAELEMAEPEYAEVDYGNQLIDYSEETGFGALTDGAGGPAAPEAWVYSEGEWMIYLGRNQSSFDYDYQMELYTMPLVQLIDALHTDILLREDTELALEFPSLGLLIDRRDDACIDLSLQQLYNCHVAAVAMGTISVDLVHSPYFAHTQTDTTTFKPSHESFAFIIHTRPSVSTTLERIMQVVEEYNSNQELESTVPESPHQPAEEAAAEEEARENGDEEPASNHQHHQNGHLDEQQQTGTAGLYAAIEDDEDEDEDDDFVVEEEEEGDHVLDEDAVDEDDEEVEAEAAAEFEDETHVDSVAASPARKRTTDEVVSFVDIEDGDEEEESSEPVAKRSKSGDDEDISKIVNVDC